MLPSDDKDIIESSCRDRAHADRDQKTEGKKSIAKLPELLSPAGSPAAMIAAINAGADAVYFGMPDFNARINADNFTSENIGEYLRLCRLMGVKAYVTLNTQIYKREKEAFLKTARLALEAGADAAIVGDLGAAALLREHLPELPLHASTQLSGHNSLQGAELSRLGFSRMVCAREMPLSDMQAFVKESPIEAEIFIHGALCVCHSGQCLFSSLVGGRSGNRGLCAQPCRLPYKIGNGGVDRKGRDSVSYPLSLKDACLAKHIPEIIDSGVASLKIEGRMKPAEYVGRVTAIYRRLLDQRRAATDAEVAYLADVFSRGGSFTDGYFTSSVSKDMLGVRSDRDKERSRIAGADQEMPKERKIGVAVSARIKRGEPMELSLAVAPSDIHRYSNTVTAVSVKGEPPLEAISRPTDRALAEKNLLKLGSTRFSAAEVNIEIDEGIMVPVSALNSLRRSATDALEELLSSHKANGSDITQISASKEAYAPKGKAPKKRIRAALFTEASRIPPSAEAYFDEIYLPATEFARKGAETPSFVNGVVLPPVIFDSERDRVDKMLSLARKAGAVYALCGNVGHYQLAARHGFELRGDFRLNVSNAESANALASLGFEVVTASPELTPPKVRDVAAESSIGVRAIVYGKIPLMIVEKCVICEGLKRGNAPLCPIKSRGEVETVCRGVLTDRTGAEFTVMREFDHRNVIYNSVPVYMGDKKQELDALSLEGEVYIFSDESREEAARVIEGYSSGRAFNGHIRRMGVREKP